MKKFLNIQIVIAIMCLICMWAFPVHADSLASVDVEVDEDGKIVAHMMLNTDERINAIEGVLYFPNNLLKIQTIHYGNSSINFWVEPPKLKEGVIPFSGIVPGGFIGEGNMFTVIFSPRDEGDGTINFRYVKGYANDGKGTPVRVLTEGNTISSADDRLAIDDAFAPESFEVHLAQSEYVFDNDWFISFATQDKQSGIRQYKVKEYRHPYFSFLYLWDSRAESPYRLRDQELKSFVAVKAIDNEGNAETTIIAPQYDLEWYESYFFLLSGILICIILFIWIRKKHS